MAYIVNMLNEYKRDIKNLKENTTKTKRELWRPWHKNVSMRVKPMRGLQKYGSIDS